MTSSPATKSVEDLRSRISGEALVEGDSGYEDSRHIWNGMIERRPAVVVQPRDTADVVEAVNYARANNQAISVKGGRPQRGRQLGLRRRDGHRFCEDAVGYR